MIVRISAEAERDMEAISDYIARDGPIRALSFIRTLRAKCLSLADLCRMAIPWCRDMSGTGSDAALLETI